MPTLRIDVVEDPMNSYEPNTMKNQIADVPRQNKPVSSLLTTFGDETSMHGLGRAISGKRTWKRVVWALLVVVGTCFAVWNFHEITQSYLSYPVSTSLTLIAHRQMIFPAVTICNLNPLRVSALDERIHQVMYEGLQRGYSRKMQEERFLEVAAELYNNVSSNKTEDLFHKIDNMLVDCQYDQEPCSASSFRTIKNFRYKRCFTFNAHNDTPRVIQRAGSQNGLILEVDVESSEYLPFVDTVGIKVLVHPQTDAPFPDDNGIVAGPGHATSIGIHQKSTIRQPPPFGNCIRAEDMTNVDFNMFHHLYEYTRDVCEKTCYQLSVLEGCHCCDRSYPCPGRMTLDSADDDFPGCNTTNITVSECVTQARTNFLSGNLECTNKCRPPCRETTYQTSYSIGSWPRDSVKETVMGKAKKSSGAEKRVSDVEMEDFVDKNLLRIEIYFESFVEETMVTDPVYNWSKVLSDIGGQLGLWLGFSILTGIEFVELLVDVGHILALQFWSRHRTAP